MTTQKICFGCIHFWKKYLFYFWLCVYVWFVHKTEGSSRGWKKVLATWSYSYRLTPMDAGEWTWVLCQNPKRLGSFWGWGIICCLVMNIPVVLPTSFTLPWILTQLSHRVLRVWDCAPTISLILGPRCSNLVTVQLLEQEGGFCSLENMVLGVVFSTIVMN